MLKIIQAIQQIISFVQSAAFILLIREIVIVCVFALILGFILGKSKGGRLKGLLALGAITLGANAILLLFTCAQMYPNTYLPLYHLAPHWGKFSVYAASYLVNTYVILEIAIASTALAGAVGYILSEGTGAFILELAVVIAAIFCAAMSAMPFYLFGIRNIAWALPTGVIFVGTLGIGAFSQALAKDKIVQFLLLLFAEILSCTLTAIIPFHFLGLDNAVWALILAIIFVCTVGYMAFGKERLRDKWMELLILLAVGAIFYAIAKLMPFELFGIENNTLALIIVFIFFLAMDAVTSSEAMLKSRTNQSLMLLWFGLALTCWIGYHVAGQAGLLLIALVAQLVLWGSLYYFSMFALPTENNQDYPALRKLFSPEFNWSRVLPGFYRLLKLDKDDQKLQIFKSLLTYNLGTNYPYYVISDWRGPKTAGVERPEPRVPGNAFMQFLAGPGIVLSSCDHLAVVTDGNNLEALEPGLAFTGLFKTIYTDVDLRPQLRGTTIQAETKDGIGAQIFTFMPHRIWTGGHLVELGHSYPYDEDAVIKAVYDHSVIEHRSPASEGQKVRWSELVTKVGPPILKDIISNYTCNELHMPFQDPDKPKYTAVLHDTLPTLRPLDVTSLSPSGKLRQFLMNRLDLDQMKDLAFDIGVRYNLFAARDQETFSSQLLQYLDEEEKLDCLINRFQQRWYNRYLARLFPDPQNCSPHKKVQIVISQPDAAGPNAEELQQEFDERVQENKITVVGMTRDRTHILVGVPDRALSNFPETLPGIPAFSNIDPELYEITDFDTLPPESQQAWHFVACEGPETLSWDQAMNLARRDPRVEIADTFVARLKEQMAPRGIEVVGGGISNIMVPQEVIEQRIENWKAKRELELEMIQAEAEAQTMLLIQETESEARLEMHTRLVQILQQASENQIRQEVLAQQLLEVIGVQQFPATSQPQPQQQPQGNGQFTGMPLQLLSISPKDPTS